MTASGPSSFWKFEEAFTRHYLGTDGPEGSAPLEFVDASQRRIAIALGRDHEDPDRVAADFLSIFTRQGLVDAFTHGFASRPPASLQVSGYLNYLLLSCYVASASPDIAESGRFHERLPDLLGLEQGISSLRGLADIWRKAERWCARSNDAGAEIRRIVLPNPGAMSRIGYSIRISFPSRHDLGRMERLVTGMPATTSPAAVVSAVNADLGRHAWSQGFLRAFGDFARRHRAGERLLADHPFWLGLENARRPDQDVSAEDASFALVVSTDLDGRDQYSLTTSDPSVLATVGLEHDDVVTVHLSLREVLRLLASAHPSVPKALKDCYAEGVVPFVELGWGTWTAQRDPAGSKARVLIRGNLIGTPPDAAGRQVWEHLRPARGEDIEALLSKVRGDRRAADNLTRLTVFGGIRIGRAFLGRRMVLPSVKAVEGCDASTAPLGDVTGKLIASSAGAEVKLSCEEPIEGVWRIAVSENGVVRSAPALAFERDAHELVLPDPERLPGWRVDEPEPAGSSEIGIAPFGALRAITTDTNLLDDLLEAIYAGGAKGWTEQRIVPLIASAVPRAGATWDVLRLLADSGWLLARSSRNWRSRRWFVTPNRLVAYAGSSEVVLDGAAPVATRRRFKTAAEECGGRVIQCGSGSDWSLPSHIASECDPAALARAMDLPLVFAAARLPPADKVLRFDQTLYTERHRHVGSTWSWSKGRFVSRAEFGTHDVTVERLETAKPNAADIYRVRKGGVLVGLLDGRSAAILTACAMAAAPMFRFLPAEGAIQRSTSEGGLPHQVVQFLRLRNRCNPWIDFRPDGSWRYRLPCSEHDARTLKSMLGKAFDGGFVEVEAADPLKVVVMTRLRGRAAGHVASALWRATC